MHGPSKQRQTDTHCSGKHSPAPVYTLSHNETNRRALGPDAGIAKSRVSVHPEVEGTERLGGRGRERERERERDEVGSILCCYKYIHAHSKGREPVGLSLVWPPAYQR